MSFFLHISRLEGESYGDFIVIIDKKNTIIYIASIVKL